jgi:inner membrane protein
MDNVAHALVGAAVGRAVGAGRVPAAGFIGAIAANAPDWTEVFVGWPWPRARYLALHRGITHSILGAAVEAVALSLIVLLILRFIALRRGTAPPTPGDTFLLIAAAVASHPLMDWQGSYGLRPFLPWSDRWYYGDFVAIVDPWFWIVPLVVLAWGGRRHWAPFILYGFVWLITTWAIIESGRADPFLKISWIALSLIGAVGWAPHWFGPARARRAAAIGLLVLSAYATMHALRTLPIKARLSQVAVRRFGPDARWAALTVAGRPFDYEPMMSGADTVAGPDWSVPRHLDVPAVRRAQRTADGRDVVSFARFMAAEVDSSRTPWRVQLRDVRYTRHGGNGWAAVTVMATP